MSGLNRLNKLCEGSNTKGTKVNPKPNTAECLICHDRYPIYWTARATKRDQNTWVVQAHNAPVYLADNPWIAPFEPESLTDLDRSDLTV